jgi:integrase
VEAITQLQMLALTTSDDKRSISMGKGLRGVVRAGEDDTVSVYVTFRYRFQGKTREPSVGTWKSKGGKSVGISLKSIFDEADRIRGKVKAGVDPVAESQLDRERELASKEVEYQKIEADKQEALLVQQQRLQALAEKQARITVKGLFESWQRNELTSRQDKGAEAERAFVHDVFDLIGDMAAADVKKAHIQEIVDAIKARATPTQDMVRTAKKILAELRQMFGFALDRDYIEADPTARIKKAKIGKDREGDRVLKESELVTIFQKLPQARMSETSIVALLLQLSTLARIGEVLSARWEHVDFKRRIWTLPDTKNGLLHDIWLSDFAVKQLMQLKEITGLTPWLFPAARAKKDRPGFVTHVCVKTVTKQVNDRQRPGAKPMSGRSKHIDALVLVGGSWTPHDLRRTGSTMMVELGALPDVADKCLNHIQADKVKRIYLRAKYEKQMREAWRLLGERLELLEAYANGTVSDLPA